MAKKKDGKLITKGRYELKFRGTNCRNCGHILHLDDKYCPACGQANSTKKLVLKDFFDEFDSKGVIPVSLIYWEMTGDKSMLERALGG